MKTKILFTLTLQFLLLNGIVYSQVNLPNGVVLPDNIVDANCYVSPPAQKWEIGEIDNTLGSIFSTVHIPLVGDIDDDGSPEIILLGENYDTKKTIYIIDGKELTIKKSFDIDDGYHGVNPMFAIGKVQWTSGTYQNIIVTMSSYTKKLYAYSPDGTKLWTSDADYYSNHTRIGAAVQIVDLDGDGWVEIVAGNKVYAAESGKLLCEAGSYNGYIQGWLNNQRYLIQSMTGSILDNGKQQICIGNTIYDVTINNRNGTSLNTMSLVKTFTPQVWNGTTNETVTSGDGAVQLIDLDLDGSLDVVVSTVIRDETVKTNSIFYMYVYSYKKDKIIATDLDGETRKYSYSGNRLAD